MKKFWTAGLLLSLGGMLPGANAGDVVATVVNRAPLATAKAPPGPPAASLGRPVVVSRYREVPPVIPAAFEEGPVTAPAPTPLVEAKPGPFPTVAILPPGDNGIRTADAVGSETGFAVERVGYTEDRVLPPAPLGPTAPTTDVYSTGAPLMGDAMTGEAPAPLRFWLSGEYLLWNTKDDETPPLVTTSLIAPDPLAPVVPQPGSGFLGDPNTRVLFGGDLDRGVQDGFRLRAGYWFDGDKPIGIEASYFRLNRDSETFSVNSDSLPSMVIARPFFALNRIPPTGGTVFNLPGQFSEIVAAPLLARGSVSIDAPSSLSGFELNGICPLLCYSDCGSSYKVNLLGGFRYLNLREGLYITEAGTIDPFTIATNAANGVPPSMNSVAFRIDDRFDTANRFYGPQAGLAGRWTTGPWSVDLRAASAWAWCTRWRPSTARPCSTTWTARPAGSWAVCWRCGPTSARSARTSSPCCPRWASTSATR